MRTLLAVLAALLLFATSLEAAERNIGIKELQEGLIELGYDVGTADGILGPTTRDAIRAFQRDKKLEPNGKYSGFLLFKVNVEVSLAREQKSAEGRKKTRDKERLLAKTNAQLIEEIEGASKKEIDEIAELIGDRIYELPARVLFSKIVTNDVF